MIKAIIFDYWNTLTNCEVTEKTLKNATLKSYNYLKSKNYNITFDELLERRKSGFLKYNEWAVKNRKELTPEESFKKYIFYDINIEEEDIKKVIEINEKYDHKHKFKENLKETLIKLKNKGYKLGIISNAWTRLTLFHLNQDGIRNLFDVIILSCDYGVRKPSKEIFNITIKKLNVNKEECIFVGDDHEDDIYGANNFGIFCTLGMKPIKIKPKIEYMPQYYIEEIYEIEDLINEIDQNIINAPISIGDLVDKVTILKIKEIKIQDTTKLKNIKKELLLLSNILKKINFFQTNKYFKELFNVNLKLWNIENSIRQLESQGNFNNEFIKLARNVYLTNDERAKIKKQINLNFNSSIIEEKDYTKYL